MKYFGQKTNAEKYLEYINEWLTIEKMADNYGLTQEKLIDIINKGRIEHETNLMK